MNIKIRQIVITAFFIVFSFTATPSLATTGFTKSLNEAGTKSGYNIVKSEESASNLSSVIGNTIKILLDFVGIIFIILIIYAGYTWMLARGNETEAQKAKDTITRAIIGLFIVLAAYAITAFVGRSI